MESGSPGNPRNLSTLAKTEKEVSVKTKSRRRSDGTEQSRGFPDGTVQENGQRCPTCSGAGRPYVDEGAAVLSNLEEAYSKLYKKYKRAKTRDLVEVEALYDEQKRKYAAFSKAADALVENLRHENDILKRQLQETGAEDSINRARQLEEEYIECRNDLVMERSKVLELEQELREAHLCILELRTSRSTMGPVLNSIPQDPCQQSSHLKARHVAIPTIEIKAGPPSLDIENVRSWKSPSALIEGKDKPSNQITINTLSGVESEFAEREPSAEDPLRSAKGTEKETCARQSYSETLAAEPGGNKLLHALFQNLTQMSAGVDGRSSQIIFTHNESGFSFKLEQNKFSQEAGGDGALLYQVITPGTILHLGPAWMKSDIVFDMVQADVFFRRIIAVALGCHSK